MNREQPIATRVSAIDPVSPDAAVIDEAAQLLRDGRLVAFPTETVYGLGTNALDETAVLRIFAAKERDPNDPLIVHIADPADLSLVAREAPPVAHQLAERFWPGGLTLVLRRHPRIAAPVSAGRDTVAIRVPAHPVAQALIRETGIPIAAPSANRFMRTSATTAEHVLDDLHGRIDMVLDGGPATAGIESTVLAIDGDHLTLLRPGAIAVETIEQTLGREVARPKATPQDPSSPGLLERHYAPTATLVYLPETPVDDVIAAAREAHAAGQRTGLLLANADGPDLEREGLLVERLGAATDLDVVASRLFAALRALDAAGAEVIYARGFARHGAGLAIHDRLRRASTALD